MKRALILCVYHVIDKISAEIYEMKLQVAILFEYLCFNTSMIKYAIAVFFGGQYINTVLRFAKLMLIAEVARIAF